MHARRFSFPYSKTIENPTRIASGVMGAYYATYINNAFGKYSKLRIKQSQEMDKDEQVLVQITKKQII
ncbi:hypothetical protein [Niallia sp. NCCP-28]|uniref:hypothetical protein n=1 Tax=Niallia sp. NCCP-28 TaxID=2934712 RepID=UPI00208161EE|nr:hypothetical protein [Niallia sp. NCCP-28]GKU80624.1 hypothetical protein NCCP28_00200 [Niallia sp. NCCP-28]